MPLSPEIFHVQNSDYVFDADTRDILSLRDGSFTALSMASGFQVCRSEGPAWLDMVNKFIARVWAGYRRTSFDQTQLDLRRCTTSTRMCESGAKCPQVDLTCGEILDMISTLSDSGSLRNLRRERVLATF